MLLIYIGSIVAHARNHNRAFFSLLKTTENKNNRTTLGRFEISGVIFVVAIRTSYVKKKITIYSKNIDEIRKQRRRGKNIFGVRL